MDTRLFVPTIAVALALTASTAWARQHEGHQLASAGSLARAQVEQCTQAQPVITGLLEAALTRLEEARLTNSAAAMRDTADDVQAALVDVRAQLAPCGQMHVASADAHAEHAMPDVRAVPGAPPGTSVAQPGHAMPAVPAPTAAPAPAAAARPPAPRQRPAAADPHAGHVTPAAPAVAAPAASAVGNAAGPAPSTPPTSIADLKCTNEVDQKTAPRMLYQGRMYYFCTEASRAEFAKDPARFVTAPPQAAPAHVH